MERLEPEHIFRNPQVAGSIPAGGSIFSIIYMARGSTEFWHSFGTGAVLGGPVPKLDSARPRSKDKR
jgi:hypothetical protein